MTQARMTMPWIRERVAARAQSTGKAAPTRELEQEALEALAFAQGRAAVAAILREGATGPEVLFIRRAEDPRDPWSGHMAFPGGRQEPGDADLVATAVRETLEEIALDLRAHARLLGELDPLPAFARGRPAGLTIAPFVFELAHAPRLSLSDEVAETVWAPLLPLIRGERATTIPYEFRGSSLTLPAHDVSGRKVWGLTYRMLDDLFACLR